MVTITALTKITEVEGFITPRATGTRLRIQPSTYVTVINSYGPNDRVTVSKVIEYLESDPVNTSVWRGDKWAEVTSINGVPVTQPAYMAIFYHGETICYEDLKVVNPEEPEPTPEPTVKYPKMILIGEDDEQITYLPQPKV